MIEPYAYATEHWAGYSKDRDGRVVSLDGEPVIYCWTAELADTWIAKNSGLMLDQVIARRDRAPDTVLVKSGIRRIGAISPDRWHLYDAWPLNTEQERVILCRSRLVEERAGDHPDVRIEITYPW